MVHGNYWYIMLLCAKYYRGLYIVYTALSVVLFDVFRISMVMHVCIVRSSIIRLAGNVSTVLINFNFHFVASYRPQALPSAGVLPFVQSLVCDLSNNSVNNTYENITLEFEGAG